MAKLLGGGEREAATGEVVVFSDLGDSPDLCRQLFGTHDRILGLSERQPCEGPMELVD